MYIVNVNCLHIHKIQYNKKVCTNTFVFVHEYVCDMNCLFVFVQMAMVYCICSHLLVYLSICEHCSLNKYFYIFVSVLVCVLVFVHLKQGLVQVELAIIPSNDYY